jgi:hypothetical protein
VGVEVFAGERRRRLIRFDPLKQRLDPAHTFGSHRPELGRIAPDRISKSGAAADLPVAQTYQHQGRLLIWGFDRLEAHSWSAHFELIPA